MRRVEGVSEREIRKVKLKEISPIDVYKLLPKTNCKECGEENCMAFAAKLVNREVALEDCPPLLKKENAEAYKKLWEMLKPPVREVAIGVGDRAVKIGGKLVMYRHEFTYINPTAITIDVTDDMPDEELFSRVKKTQDFRYEYIGQNLKLDLIAVRSTSNNPKSFRSTVEKILKSTSLPLVLCSFNPEVLKSGLSAVGKSRPLIYAATKENWRNMADLALTYDCPLVVFAPNNLKLLRSLTKTLIEYGVKDLVLDPGTFSTEGLGDTTNNFTMIRRAACKEGDELLGFPLIGTPITAWLERGASAEVASWTEAYVASMLITRYADVLLMHSLDGWVLLPNVILRQNLYTDPRKPVAIKSGLVALGKPNENSPVMFTTNFALTYYTVESDIKSGGASCHLMVVDTGGISVESSVAGRQLTADKVAEAIKQTGIESKVKHRKLIIPGRAARLSGEIEELSGWEVMVGPLDSSGIPKFLQEKWKT
jgi:acetyl-CoA decarbonylase/synthase complex subunit gamma